MLFLHSFKVRAISEWQNIPLHTIFQNASLNETSKCSLALHQNYTQGLFCSNMQCQCMVPLIVDSQILHMNVAIMISHILFMSSGNFPDSIHVHTLQERTKERNRGNKNVGFLQFAEFPLI